MGLLKCTWRFFETGGTASSKHYWFLLETAEAPVKDKQNNVKKTT